MNITSRGALGQLARFVKRDLQKRYVGSVLGVLWAFIYPITTITVIWFVFEVGFKVQPVSTDVPFVLWLMAAMVPWFFVSEAINSSCFSIIEHGGIIKKMIIPVDLLPIVKTISALIIHLAFFMLVLSVAFLGGLTPNLSWIFLIYFAFCGLLFTVGVAYLAASVTVFFRDFSHVIALVTQVGFWGTPIFWDISLIPSDYHVYVSINPVFYITEGYRQSLLGGDMTQFVSGWSLYFWLFTISLLILGRWVFNKVKPHFGEVL